jgi:hypothetical protein
MYIISLYKHANNIYIYNIYKHKHTAKHSKGGEYFNFTFVLISF